VKECEIDGDNLSIVEEDNNITTILTHCLTSKDMYKIADALMLMARAKEDEEKEV
jgi:hypothetical protein